MVVISGGDGSSIENAIIISECNHMEGIDQEYIILRNLFGNYKLNRQSLLNINNQLYDKMELKLENGKEIELYIDITAFFGKGFEF